MTLASILTGVEQQALSFKRDAEEKDYPTDHYRDHVLEEEVLMRNKNASDNLRDYIRKYGKKTIQMDRSYLKGWTTFLEKTENMDEKIRKLFYHQRDVEKNLTVLDCFAGLRALSAARYSAKDLRNEMMETAIRLYKK